MMADNTALIQAVLDASAEVVARPDYAHWLEIGNAPTAVMQAELLVAQVQAIVVGSVPTAAAKPAAPAAPAAAPTPPVTP